VNASIRLSLVAVLLSLAAQACGGAAQTAPRTAAWTPRATREERAIADTFPRTIGDTASAAQVAPHAQPQEHTTAVVAWWPRERRAERAPIAHPSLRR
jgi:hypothetical protein